MIFVAKSPINKNKNNTKQPLPLHTTSTNIQNKRSQNVSNDVFTTSPKNENFQIVQNSSKHNLFSASNDSSTETIKKNKLMLASTNRYASLANENSEIKNIETNQINIDLNTENKQIKIKPPPSIFIRGVLDFSAFGTRLIELIGVNNFVIKSTTNNLKT